MIGAELPIAYHTVTLGALTRDGDALAEITWQDEPGEERTRTLHVPAGLPGETVTIAIEAAAPPRRRKRHWKPRPPRVWITEIQQASPLRVEASCPVFGVCGGCQLQHMRYESQLEWKHSIVRQLLQESGFDNPPVLAAVACDDPWHYRNHMRFSVNRAGQPGLTARGTHRVLPLTCCPIAHRQINRVLGVLGTLPNERPQALVRCGTATGHVLIQPHPGEDVARQLVEEGLDLCSEAMEERLGGESFRIRPSSFFQTNTAQAEKMVRMVLDGLLDGTASAVSSHPVPTTIVDAYCGVGTFALLLARHVDKVIAIEESASAIRDAEWNLREVHNVEIRKGKVEDLLPTLECRVDGLVIDPPRAGCQQAVLDALLRHPVGRIVYVSCDPATLARDLHILCNVHPTYRLRSVQPLDMFPQTAHIECVAVLEHRQL
ncbi:MAG TPA: class I SAM-dependent RNA methyltransferase [Ktedonobacteraceae bacterium]|nr:class I SAM-dependent RNA methyltransferase [Ktedonobacteraceae bacterium]